MAWHYGTFACGHEGRVNIVGPIRDRDWKAEREFSKLCDECWEKHLEEERVRINEEAKQAAKEMELPELQGTEKQVAWAITLRDKLIKKFDKVDQNSLKEYQELGLLKDITFDDILRIKHYILDTKTRASYYINNRFENLLDIIEANKKEALKSKEEIKQKETEKQLLNEIKLEATVFPKDKITNAVAEIEIKDNAVEVHFERNDDFRKLVRSLGYEWDGKWIKEITETTGSAEERAAELGNKLLNAGFPICILEEDVRNNAINGIYEPECTRWIYYRKKTGHLAINWLERDDSLYKRARSLPSSIWDNPSVIVKINHYEEVEEFAELYGFRFTKASKKAISAYKERLKDVEVVSPAEVKEQENVDGLERILESGDEILDDLKD